MPLLGRYIAQFLIHRPDASVAFLGRGEQQRPCLPSGFLHSSSSLTTLSHLYSCLSMKIRWYQKNHGKCLAIFRYVSSVLCLFLHCQHLRISPLGCSLCFAFVLKASRRRVTNENNAPLGPVLSRRCGKRAGAFVHMSSAWGGRMLVLICHFCLPAEGLCSSKGPCTAYRLLPHQTKGSPDYLLHLLISDSWTQKKKMTGEGVCLCSSPTKATGQILLFFLTLQFSGHTPMGSSNS